MVVDGHGGHGVCVCVCLSVCVCVCVRARTHTHMRICSELKESYGVGTKDITINSVSFRINHDSVCT